MDEVKNGVIDLLPKITESRVIGEATVLQLFDIHLKAKVTKKVAGCRVTNGVVEKNKKARVVRNGEVVFDGQTNLLCCWGIDALLTDIILQVNLRP